MSVRNPFKAITMRRFRNGIQKLVHSTAGTALIETAIIAPFVSIIIMGTTDIALYGAAKLKVQQGINRGLEMAMMAGPTQSIDLIKAEAASQANVDAANVTVTQSQTCAGVAQTWGTNCATGEYRKFIQIQVTSSYRPTFVMGSLARRNTLVNGRMSISASGYIRVS